MDPLLTIVKNILDITWTDPKLDEKLEVFLADGRAYIGNVAGDKEIDFDSPGLARKLLVDYVRYARSNASEMFWQNFEPELRALRKDSEVMQYEASEQSDNTGV